MTSKRKLIAHGYEDRRMRILAEEAVGPNVLDLGYAEKPNRHLLDRGDLRVTGFDLQDAPGSGYVESVQGDVTELPGPLDDRRFECVIAGELIEHLEDPYDFLRRVRELLTPDGRLILSTPNPLSFPMVFFELAGERSRFYCAGHTYSFPPRWLERMLELTGFDLLRTRPVGLWVPGLQIPWAPKALSYQLVYVARPKAPDSVQSSRASVVS